MIAAALRGVVRPSLTRRLVVAQLGLLVVVWTVLIVEFLWDITITNQWYEPQQLRERAEMIFAVIDGLADRPAQLQEALLRTDVFQRRENREEDEPSLRVTMNVWRDGKLLYASPGRPGVVRTTVRRHHGAYRRRRSHAGARTRNFRRMAARAWCCCCPAMRLQSCSCSGRRAFCCCRC